MGVFRTYVINVANAVTGRSDSFKGDAAEENLYAYSLSVVLLYLLFIISFSIGAALLSYKYNQRIGTSPTMTVIYAGLAFVFSSFYYPFYAFFLDPVPSKNSRR